MRAEIVAAELGLNNSEEFRSARTEFHAAKTPEELGRAAETFLRKNRQQKE